MTDRELIGFARLWCARALLSEYSSERWVWLQSGMDAPEHADATCLAQQLYCEALFE